MNDIFNIQESLDKLIKGDPGGEKAIFIMYYSYIMSICIRYAKNKQDAEEILNDTFLKCFNRISSYDRNRVFKNWLGAIAVNTSIDFLRKQKSGLNFIELGEDLEELKEEPLEWDENSLVLPVIQALPAQYRLVFNLMVFEEYSHKQIAEKLKISIGTSKSNFSRAKKIVKDKLIKIRQQAEEI